MQREQAIEIYKQIITSCRIELSYVSLMPPNTQDTSGTGYQLHIAPSTSDYDKERLQKIVKDQQLAFRELGDRLVIYKPADQKL